MVMEIPETVISTRQVNEDELQAFNKVRVEYFEIYVVFARYFEENCYLLGSALALEKSNFAEVPLLSQIVAG